MGITNFTSILSLETRGTLINYQLYRYNLCVDLPYYIYRNWSSKVVNIVHTLVAELTALECVNNATEIFLAMDRLAPLQKMHTQNERKLSQPPRGGPRLWTNNIIENIAKELSKQTNKTIFYDYKMNGEGELKCIKFNDFTNNSLPRFILSNDNDLYYSQVLTTDKLISNCHVNVIKNTEAIIQVTSLTHYAFTSNWFKLHTFDHKDYICDFWNNRTCHLGHWVRLFVYIACMGTDFVPGILRPTHKNWIMIEELFEQYSVKLYNKISQNKISSAADDLAVDLLLKKMNVKFPKKKKNIDDIEKKVPVKHFTCEESAIFTESFFKFNAYNIMLVCAEILLPIISDYRFNMLFTCLFQYQEKKDIINFLTPKQCELNEKNSFRYYNFLNRVCWNIVYILNCGGNDNTSKIRVDNIEYVVSINMPWVRMFTTDSTKFQLYIRDDKFAEKMGDMVSKK